MLVRGAEFIDRYQSDRLGDTPSATLWPWTDKPPIRPPKQAQTPRSEAVAQFRALIAASV